MTEAMKRPSDFRMGFQSKEGSPGSAWISVAAFSREHIPFLIKALGVADDILALDERTETAQKHDASASPTENKAPGEA